eukprot:GHRR01013619.1.p1 GENE.GHRR01013619.1~~GHRR01013619.1.p1  ORF type:complete len:165 (-),score=30.49 GHRR01013619.1:771-1265(-)
MWPTTTRPHDKVDEWASHNEIAVQAHPHGLVHSDLPGCTRKHVAATAQTGAVRLCLASKLLLLQGRSSNMVHAVTRLNAASSVTACSLVTAAADPAIHSCHCAATARGFNKAAVTVVCVLCCCFQSAAAHRAAATAAMLLTVSQGFLLASCCCLVGVGSLTRDC